MFGNVGVFEEEKEQFADYMDRYDAFLAANDIPADRRANLFWLRPAILANSS